MERNRIQDVVLAELGGIWWDLAEYSRIQWNLAEYGRIWQIAVRLPHIAVRLPSCGRSLIIKLVETGGRV